MTAKQTEMEAYLTNTFPATLDAAYIEIGLLRAQVADLERELAEVRVYSSVRHMVRIGNPDRKLICPKCGKPMELYLEEDRLTPPEWLCVCGRREVEPTPGVIQAQAAGA